MLSINIKTTSKQEATVFIESAVKIARKTTLAIRGNWGYDELRPE